MGLDANIIKISIAAEQLPLLRKHLHHLKLVWQAACNGKPLYKATPEEEAAYLQSLEMSVREEFTVLNYDFGNAKEVKHPATKNPYGNVGYWRVGYGEIDPKKNYVLGTLYEAFPRLHPNWGGYFGADWAYAQQIVLSRIEELKAKEDVEKIAKLEVFLETIDYILSQPDPETYFLNWFP